MSKDKLNRSENFVISGPELPGGGRMAVHHKPDHILEPTIIHPFREGVSIPDEAILLRRREDSNIYDVEESISEMKNGPSQISTKAYREGYERTFGKKDLN